MQIFNEFNNRRLDNKFNIFEGLHRNKFFIVINCLMVGLQIAIIFVGGQAFSIIPGGLSGTQWAVCIVLAVLCMPWAVLVRLFPDPWFARVAKIVGGPVAIAYRALGRFFSRAGRVFKKTKSTEDEETAAKDVEGEVREKGSHSDGSVPAESPSVVVSSADPLPGPEIKVEEPAAEIRPVKSGE